jgi:pimeloyl-ACP methyl ester carboxylesterase
MSRLSCLRRAAPLLPLLLTLLLPACSTPYRPPLVPPATFPGLIDLAAQADGREADVLLVHGICTHDANWAGEVVPQLARALADATTAPGARRAAATTATATATVEIVPSTVSTPAGRLRFDALIWSPLTNDLKRQLCYDQSGKSSLCAGAPPYPYTRARLNARFKDGLIDDCLPDALIYQGVARDTIQQRMREAVLQVLSTARADVPLVVIAHSMGSKILFDTLLRMTEEPAGSTAARVAQQAVDRMRFLVMAANQIPLLSLADQRLAEAGVATATQPDSLQLLLRKRQAGQRRALDHHLTLVAFTDPNDLLSYTLEEEKYAQEGITVYNILVSNAPTWLGLLERPDTAHLEYLSNPDVGRLIACGQPISKLCI